MDDVVTLGTTLRALRVARGLSQEALGAPTHSASYVSRVESGHRRPSPETLGLLCERLGTTPRALAAQAAGAGVGRAREEIELDLAWAKIAVRAGNPASAEKYARLVLADVAVPQATRLDALTLLATATEGQGRVQEAIAILEDLQDDLDPDATHALWTSATVTLMRCYQRVGDVDLAIDLGRAVMARLGPVWDDDETVLVVCLAQAHRRRGDLTRARMLLETALSRSEHTGGGRARGSALWNASMVAADEGRTDDAVRLSQRALAVLGEADARRNLARLHANCADMLLEHGADDAMTRARAHLESAAEGLDLEGDVGERAGVLAELARCDLADGDLAAAEGRLLAARLVLVDGDDSLGAERAWVDLLDAHLSVARGEVADGLARARAAAEDTERHESAEEAARTWRAVADLARAHDDPALLVHALERTVALAGVRPTVVPVRAHASVRAAARPSAAALVPAPGPRPESESPAVG